MLSGYRPPAMAISRMVSCAHCSAESKCGESKSYSNLSMELRNRPQKMPMNWLAQIKTIRMPRCSYAYASSPGSGH